MSSLDYFKLRMCRCRFGVGVVSVVVSADVSVSVVVSVVVSIVVSQC